MSPPGLSNLKGTTVMSRATDVIVVVGFSEKGVLHPYGLTYPYRPIVTISVLEVSFLYSSTQ